MKQGPKWEADLVGIMRKLGREAKRIDKSGERGVSDIRVGVGGPNVPVFLAWKRYLGAKAQGRRTTRTVVVMDLDTWIDLLRAAACHDFYIEAKATQTLSVTAVLDEAIDKVRNGKGEY